MLLSFLRTKIKSAVIRKNISYKNRLEGIRNILSFLDKEKLYPTFYPIEQGLNEPICVVEGKKYLMFASNNYLNLSEDKEVKDAAIRSINQYGLGPGGSRVISGDTRVVRDLEMAIAKLTNTEDCLTFPTGYMANVAVFQAIMDPLFYDLPAKSTDGVIFSDENNHGSIVDGCRLSKAKKVIFKHDDLVDLRAKLVEHQNIPNKLIVTEGVFSLDGEIINLPKYIELAQEFGAKFMVDDAHGIGVIGKSGGGTTEVWECSEGVDILMGCMDKAFGGTGGFLCGSKELIRYLRIASRSSILSSSLPAGMAGAMIESVNKIKSMEMDRNALLEKAEYLSKNLQKLGFKVLTRDKIPVVVLFAGKEATGIEFSNKLWERGIFSPVVRWPAVPEGESRFRLLIMRNHTYSDLDHFIDACRAVGKELRLIN